MELWETSVVILSHYSAYNHPSTVRISHIEPLNGLSPPPIESIRLVIVVLPFYDLFDPSFGRIFGHVKPLFEVNRGGFYVYKSWTFDLLPPSFLLNKIDHFVEKTSFNRTQ
jgi:hypothetical protein